MELSFRLMHDILVELYKNPLNKEKSLTIATEYQSLFDDDVRLFDKLAPVLSQQKDLPLNTAAYEVVERLGMQWFSNPDIINKPENSILIYNLDCSQPVENQIDKIVHLECNTVVSFINIDKASKEVQEALIKLTKNNPHTLGFQADSMNINPELLSLLYIENKKTLKP